MIPRRSRAIVVVAAISFVALSAFKAHQSLIGQGALFLLTPVFVGCLAIGVIEPFHSWRTYKLRTLIPLAACVIAWCAAYPVGAFLQSRLFIHNLPRFRAIVDGIQAESLPPDGTSKMLPVSKDDQTQIQHVFAHKASDGTVIVEIDTENGFPVKHSGYVYSASGVFPADPEFHDRWPYVDEVRPQWFRVSD